MRLIIPQTLVQGLSESLIGYSVCLVVFSKIFPKVCKNLYAPHSGSTFLATGMPPYIPGNVHEINEIFRYHPTSLLRHILSSTIDFWASIGYLKIFRVIFEKPFLS